MQWSRASAKPTRGVQRSFTVQTRLAEQGEAGTTNAAIDIFAIVKVLWDMFYFYILQCADNKRYYGYTNNLKKRSLEHQRGKNRATRPRRLLKLIYYEECDTNTVAIKRERQFKQGRTRKSTIDKLITEFPADRLSKFQ